MVRINLHEEYVKYSSCTRFLFYSLGIPRSTLPFDKLQEMGFINLFLDDYSKGERYKNENAGLVIFNPAISFVEDGNMDKVVTYFKQRPNFIELIEYGYYIYGIWLMFDKKYPDLRYLYKKGLYSQFPKSYFIQLNKEEYDICNRTKSCQERLEKRLGLSSGDLDGVELASLPEIKDFVFDLRKFVKHEMV